MVVLLLTAMAVSTVLFTMVLWIALMVIQSLQKDIKKLKKTKK